MLAGRCISGAHVIEQHYRPCLLVVVQVRGNEEWRSHRGSSRTELVLEALDTFRVNVRVAMMVDHVRFELGLGCKRSILVEHVECV